MNVSLIYDLFQTRILAPCLFVRVLSSKLAQHPGQSQGKSDIEPLSLSCLTSAVFWSQYLSSPPSSPVRRLLSVGASRWASVLTELPSWQDKTKTKQDGSPSHFLEVQYTCETILSPSVGANYMLFKAKVKDGLSCSKPPSQSNPRVHTISLTIQFSFTVALASNSVIMWISIFRRLGTDWGLPLMSCVNVVMISTPKSIRNWVYLYINIYTIFWRTESKTNGSLNVG